MASEAVTATIVAAKVRALQRPCDALTTPASQPDRSSRRTRVALLCSGLGTVRRGHEVFARDLFELVRDAVDISLFKGGGAPAPGETVIPHVPRDAPELDGMHLCVAPKWHAAAVQVERMRVEGETFAYGALPALLVGDFDVLHCLEQEVCQVLWAHRHLFARTPAILWSNGGALPAADQPPCDAVQEYTDYNLQRSARGRAFLIPHAVDTRRFHPGVVSSFRQRHGIPAEAFVVITVGSICYWHKRTDHVIREVSQVPGAWLVVAGQETPDTAAIKTLGRELLGDRVIFTSLSHDALPDAYAAADVFTLGSLFETFGIVYIEAMAMGLPVVCTDHPNQRGIVKDGVFVDMRAPGALARALRETPTAEWARLREQGPKIVQRDFDAASVRQRYVDVYDQVAGQARPLPAYTWAVRLKSNAINLRRVIRRVLRLTA